MPRVGDVFQLLSGTLAVPNTTIQSAPYNAQQNDWVTEANSPRPVSAGGTGETTEAAARESLGAIGVGDLANADTKAVLVDTDSVVIIDSNDASTNKRWLVSDLETYLLTLNPPTAQGRNRLVNGAMQISQQNGSGNVSTATGSYPLDQWKITRTVTTGIISCQQRVATSSLEEAPYWLQMQTTTDQATVSSGVWHMSQTIEGNKTSDFGWGLVDSSSQSVGKPAVLRLRVKTNTEGTYGFFIRNNPGTHTYVGTFTISSAEASRFVEKIIPIPAPPNGSVWATTTGAGITVGLTLAAQSTWLAATPGWKVGGSVYGVTGQINFIGVFNADIAFSAVALYMDPDNTAAPPKWEMPDYAEDLIACQRYWVNLQTGAPVGMPISSGHVVSATSARFRLSTMVPMRALPFFATGAGTVIQSTGAAIAPSSYTLYWAEGGFIDMQATIAGGTVGAASLIASTATTLNARL